MQIAASIGLLLLVVWGSMKRRCEAVVAVHGGSTKVLSNEFVHTVVMCVISVVFAQSYCCCCC